MVSIPQVPSAPQNLKAVSGDGEVTLIWSAPEKVGTGPITKYAVYWSTTKPTGENPTSENMLETEADVTTTSVTGLTNGATYYFWVVANNHAGRGTASEAATAIPLDSGGAVAVDSTDGFETALENDAVTDIEVVGDITYDESILAEKNITVKSGATLTLKYNSGFYIPYGATTCNSNIRVEQGGTIAFEDTCWWSSMFTNSSICLLYTSAQAVATSIDALAVGVSFAALQVKILPAAALIACTTFFLSLLAVGVGKLFGGFLAGKAGLAGGVILIIIGLRILLGI